MFYDMCVYVFNSLLLCSMTCAYMFLIVYNNNNIYLKSNIQCTYRYEFSGLYNNNIQLQ